MKKMVPDKEKKNWIYIFENMLSCRKSGRLRANPISLEELCNQIHMSDLSDEKISRAIKSDPVPREATTRNSPAPG